MPAVGASVLGLSRVEGWGVTHLNEAAGYWSTVADAWEHVFTGLRGRVAAAEWRGQAHDVALDRADTDMMRVRGPVWALRDAVDIARAGAGDLAAAKQRALNAVDGARAAGFEVRGDLTVSAYTSARSVEQAMALQPQANEMTTEIRSAAADLADLDRHVATKIAAATADLHGFSFPPETPIHPPTPAQGNGIQAVDFKQSPPPPDPGGPPPPKPVYTGQDVRDLLKDLDRGISKRVKQVDSSEEMRRLYDWLTRNSVGDGTRPTYDGPRRVLPDGTEIGLREGGRSPGPTIDVKFPDGSERKIHIPPVTPFIGAPPHLPSLGDPAPVGIPPTVLDHPPVAVPPVSQPTPALPPWLADPSPPGFQIAPPGSIPDFFDGLMPVDVPDAPSTVPPMPAPSGPPITLPSLPAPPPEAVTVAGGLAAVGAAILAGMGWLAHPFGP